MISKGSHNGNLPQDMSCPRAAAGDGMDVFYRELLTGPAVRSGSDSAKRPLPEETKHIVSIANFEPHAAYLGRHMILHRHSK